MLSRIFHIEFSSEAQPSKRILRIFHSPPPLAFSVLILLFVFFFLSSALTLHGTTAPGRIDLRPTFESDANANVSFAGEHPGKSGQSPLLVRPHSFVSTSATQPWTYMNQS